MIMINDMDYQGLAFSPPSGWSHGHQVQSRGYDGLVLIPTPRHGCATASGSRGVTRGRALQDDCSQHRVCDSFHVERNPADH